VTTARIRGYFVGASSPVSHTHSPMTSSDDLQFSAAGPFDDWEQVTIRAVHDAIEEDEPGSPFAATVRRNVSLISRLAELLSEFPSVFEAQSLGKRQRNLKSLIDMLSRADLSNFDVFLPTRSLLGRTLIMAEMNFYRFLRYVATESLSEERAAEFMPRTDKHLCHCIYTRLAGDLLTSISSDNSVNLEIRKRAVLSLLQVREQIAVRISDFLPLLQATWDARRNIVVTGGTLMGTTEMFQLLERGCDGRFVDLLVRPDHTQNEAEAFREFLFGATTEHLAELEEMQAESNTQSAKMEGLSNVPTPHSLDDSASDPTLAMFEFFLSRHLQAAARRQGGLPGPKRTAEEYVMIQFLRTQDNLSRD
jgi:hypothetical protein